MSRILLKEEQEGYKEQLLEFAEALVFSHTFAALYHQRKLVLPEVIEPDEHLHCEFSAFLYKMTESTALNVSQDVPEIYEVQEFDRFILEPARFPAISGIWKLLRSSKWFAGQFAMPSEMKTVPRETIIAVASNMIAWSDALVQHCIYLSKALTIAEMRLVLAATLTNLREIRLLALRLLKLHDDAPVDADAGIAVREWCSTYLDPATPMVLQAKAMVFAFGTAQASIYAFLQRYWESVYKVVFGDAQQYMFMFILIGRYSVNTHHRLNFTYLENMEHATKKTQVAQIPTEQVCHFIESWIAGAEALALKSPSAVQSPSIATASSSSSSSSTSKGLVIDADV